MIEAVKEKGWIDLYNKGGITKEFVSNIDEVAGIIKNLISETSK